jgi:DNA-binding PucR family transcriptional regulator
MNPNTVVYRLRRIRELSGRDPHDVDDLLVLVLALKLADLRSSC